MKMMPETFTMKIIWALVYAIIFAMSGWFFVKFIDAHQADDAIAVLAMTTASIWLSLFNRLDNEANAISSGDRFPRADVGKFDLVDHSIVVPDDRVNAVVLY